MIFAEPTQPLTCDGATACPEGQVWCPIRKRCVPAPTTSGLADRCPPGYRWCFFRRRCVPRSEYPGPPGAADMFGLDVFGQPDDDMKREVVIMWAVGSALTLGVIGLGVFLALRAGRGAERIATKYIEAKHAR